MIDRNTILKLVIEHGGCVCDEIPEIKVLQRMYGKVGVCEETKCYMYKNPCHNENITGQKPSRERWSEIKLRSARRVAIRLEVDRILDEV